MSWNSLQSLNHTAGYFKHLSFILPFYITHLNGKVIAETFLDVSVQYQLHIADIKYETSYLCLFPALNLLYKLYNTQTMFKHI